MRVWCVLNGSDMKFERIFVAGSVLLAAFFVVGCGAKKAESTLPGPVTEALDHDHFSQTPQGKQIVESADGTKTEVLDSPDLETFGLKVFPGAELGQDNAAYLSTGPTVESIRYEVYTDKSVNEVKDFYVAELGVEPSILRAEEALISGRLADGNGVVVTVLAEAGGRTLIRVEVMRPPKD